MVFVIKGPLGLMLGERGGQCISSKDKKYNITLIHNLLDQKGITLKYWSLTFDTIGINHNIVVNLVYIMDLNNIIK
jgi:hypothetical protein